MIKKIFMIMIGLFHCFGAISAENRGSTDEKGKVIQRLGEFTDLINNGKTQNLSSYWSQGAEIVAPITGEHIEGNQEVTQYLQKKIYTLKGKRVKFDIQKVDFPDSDSAIVEGLVEISDQGKVVDRQARRIELVKLNGEWLLDFFSEIPVDLAPTSSHEHLKDLEWLLGSWKDQDDNVTIQFTAKWDKFKNFLIQNFYMSIYGVDTLEGLQVIGWDPVAEKIRSWVYDSDGGFGSGIWSKTEEGWSVKLNYTLSDGTTGSSTNNYTKIKEKSYSYSSTHRKVGNISLPNIEPMTVIKED